MTKVGDGVQERTGQGQPATLRAAGPRPRGRRTGDLFR
jgi:hypothetical protein